MTKNMTAFLSATARIALAGALMPATAAIAQAADSSARDVHAFAIPAARLSQSILALSEQADVQVVFDSETTGSVEGNAVSGRLTLSQALDRLLAGTGLSWRWLRNGIVTIENASSDGERVTTAVRVEGTQGSPYFGGAGQMSGVNGVNGSRDITSTEGTGSFTSGALTIGSKVPQAIKDVPQSISVLTSERMEQQNVTDFTAAMRQLPGISLTQGLSSLESTYFSRGFPINAIQIDGGVPIFTSTNDSPSTGYFPQIDMSQYDHVELVRGAIGTFSAYGSPAGTINLVRKKPLDHGQVLVEAQVGSWDHYRAMVDATSPLGLDGKLRGRLVMTYQDNKHFYDTAKDNKTLIYGIAELDVTPTTLLTAGISHTRQNSVPWYNGLPRYQTGKDIGLPRDLCLCFAWNRWDFDTTELFGTVEQKIGEDWTAKVNITRSKQSSTRKVGYSSGAVNPLSLRGPSLYGAFQDFGTTQISAEGTVFGAFNLFGERQEITAGVNRTSTTGDGRLLNYPLFVGTSDDPYQPYPGGPTYYYGSPDGSNPPINVFNFDPNNPIYIQPADTLPIQRFDRDGSIQSTAYLALRLTPFSRLHFSTGIRWSRYEYKQKRVNICYAIPSSGTPASYNCVGRSIGDEYLPFALDWKDDDFSWPPTSALTFDITNELSAYASYADIYQSQATYYDDNVKPLAPITGSNIEGGLKWQSVSGKLNASLSVYRIKQSGYPVFDGTIDNNVTSEERANGIYYYVVAGNGTRVPNGRPGPGLSCCYRADKNRTYSSKGIDLEVTGEIFKALQLSASYSYNRNELKGTYFGPDNGQPFASIQPKNLYKIWASYDFGSSGRDSPLSRLTLSGGLSGQSSGYYAGHVCVNLAAPDPTTGLSPCRTYAQPDYIPYDFVVPPNAVLSARADYKLLKNVEVSIFIENVLDKKYYATVGSVSSGNWYGQPRNITFAVHAKW